MPFRFRKTLKLGKGLKLNLSKSGISTSIGGRGFSLNLGKRGIKTTVGIPGSGLSFSKTNSSSSTASTPPPAVKSSKSASGAGCLNGLLKLVFFPFQILDNFIKSVANPQTRRSSLILGGSVLGFCLFCFGATFVMDATGMLTTPTPTLDLVAIQSTAQAGVFQSFTQTAQAIPTLTATSTVQPTSTNTPAPTATSFPTFTAVPTLAVVVPNNPPAAAVCSCSGDSLNCGDFSSHANAQACFNYCVSVGAGDIHRLDRDNNGLACESLP